MAVRNRYEGNPLVRLLEYYVLDAIGELKADDRTFLEKVAPKLQDTYRVRGSWKQVLSQAMHFPASLDDNIRMLWIRNRDLAAQHGEDLLAEDFARMFVDKNFVPE